VIRNRSALAAAAILVAVVASACSSNSATFPAGGSGGAPGASAGASAVNPNNPQSIVDHVLGGGEQLISGSQVVKSFHVKAALNGTIKASGLSGLSQSAAGLVTSDIKLDGTALEGDVDVVNQAAHLTFNMPALQALGGTPISADIIYIGSAVYVKTDLLGPKYNKLDASSLSGLTSALPVSIPTAGASALSNVGNQVTDIQKQLQDAGAKATLVGTEKIGGKDAYHVNISLPADKINSMIAAKASPSAAPLTVDSVSIDLWAYTDTYNLAQLEVKGTASALGNLDLIVTVTNYDQPVTVTAPDPSAVQTFGLGS
jgi:hypothetical protein